MQQRQVVERRRDPRVVLAERLAADRHGALEQRTRLLEAPLLHQEESEVAEGVADVRVLGTEPRLADRHDAPETLPGRRPVAELDLDDRQQAQALRHQEVVLAELAFAQSERLDRQGVRLLEQAESLVDAADRLEQPSADPRRL